MKNLKMGLVSLDQQNNHGIMDEENQDSSSEISSNFSSSSSSDSELFDVEDENEEKGEGEEGDFSVSIDSTSPNSSISHDEHTVGALQNMSTLLQELPFKRGLSKHYNGKSQSFTSLSNVRSLEDMAKPENPYNKKLKSCKSYGIFLEGFKSDHLQPTVIRSSSSSKLSSKRGSCSSLRAKRNGSFLGNNSRPPVPPHRSTSTTSFTSQTPLFA